ncbi:MAG: glycoside hydrolase family 25 protein [Oscillospiraceae bacterium]|nr:glycoside hydrolase family 25 protein [Oscillospiraceae bacterium]
MDALKEMTQEDIFQDTFPEAAEPETAEITVPPALPRRKHLAPEAIMGIIAGVCALFLAIMVVLCLPYFNPDEDPESLPQRHEPQRATEAVIETFLEPTVSETEPENPTIPPDRNPYDRFDFQYNRHNYLLLQNVKSYPGVDVSAYQGNIDWAKVKASGIDFAIIRLGYRGYESGKLVIDDYAQKNLAEARAAGLRVGAYFFSQALTIKEVDEEIAFMMDVLDGFLPDMPLILDWEIPAANARTAKMDARTLTDLQLHYCKVITEKGYQPMVYFNWHQSEHLYYLSELEDYPFWLALYQDRMTYPWKVEMWQYTCTGRVPGIQGDVDINVYMPY